MKTYSIVSNHPRLIDEISSKLNSAGFKQDNEKPDFLFPREDGLFLMFPWYISIRNFFHRFAQLYFDWFIQWIFVN